jgi:hypothetical protein
VEYALAHLYSIEKMADPSMKKIFHAEINTMESIK